MTAVILLGVLVLALPALPRVSCTGLRQCMVFPCLSTMSYSCCGTTSFTVTANDLVWSSTTSHVLAKLTEAFALIHESSNESDITVIFWLSAVRNDRTPAPHAACFCFSFASASAASPSAAAAVATQTAAASAASTDSCAHTLLTLVPYMQPSAGKLMFTAMHCHRSSSSR